MFSFLFTLSKSLKYSDIVDEAVLAGPELHEGGCGRQRHHAHQRARHPHLLPLRDLARRAHQHIQGNLHIITQTVKHSIL